MLALVLLAGGFWFVGWNQWRHDEETSAQFTYLTRQAQGRSIEKIGELIDSASADLDLPGDQILWFGQRVGNAYLKRAGNVATIQVSLPEYKRLVDTIAGLKPFTSGGAPQQVFAVRGMVKAYAIGNERAVLFVGRDLRSERIDLQSGVTLGVFFLATVALTLFLSAYFTVGFVVRRLRQISNRAEEISRGDLSQRITESDRKDEFDALSRALNRMLDRAEKLLSGMKEVTDNVAHDLRTPLYRLRTRIELALIDSDRETIGASTRDALELALREADGLLATFTSLLSIARLESGAMRDSLMPVEMSEVIRDVAELYAPLAEDRGVHLESAVAPGLKVWSNRSLLLQALSNLVDNAVKYSPTNTKITIGAQRVHESQARGRIDVYVADQGPGIPEADRQRVLERFVRLDAARGMPGNGLGLSLVAAVANLHEAPILLESSKDGRGLTVRLRLAAA